MKSTAPRLAAVACAITLLIPVWVPALLATTDGPSHLYNAVVAADLIRGGGTYGTWLDQGTALAPNRAANTVLSRLVLTFGATLAEKLLFSFTLLGTFAVLAAVARRETSLSAAMIIVCAWLAQHWFAWTGFFDFSLSVLGFAALLVILVRPSGLQRDMLIQAAAVFLAWTHLFTFAIGVALTSWIQLLRATRERRPAQLLSALPPVLLLALLIAAGGTGGGGAGWGDPAKAIAGLVIGDFIATFHPIDLLAGVIIMAAFWIVLVSELRSAARLGIDSAPALPVFAAGLVLLSLLAPDALGEGSYISARLRFLAVLVLLPAIGRRAARLEPRARLALGGALLVTLVVHSVIAVRTARVVSSDAAAIDTLVGAASARAGDAVQTALSDLERGAFRISAYAHLHARAAIRRRLIVLDNYEARLDVFPTRWRDQPAMLGIERNGDTLQLRRRDGVSWERPIHLVHETGDRLVAADPAVVIQRTVRGADLAVTTVTLDPAR